MLENFVNNNVFKHMSELILSIKSDLELIIETKGTCVKKNQISMQIYRVIVI